MGALIVVLGVLIFIHEAGHFIAAKLAGIHVHRFSLGLGTPIKALSFTRGGTEYAISWIPLGGYVKMATAEEEVTSSALEGGKPIEEVPRDQYFESKSVGVRMIVILAGVTMNALFAWGVFSFLLAKNGQPFNPTTTVGFVLPDGLPQGGEALSALAIGDSITGVGDVSVDSWNEIQQQIQFTSADSVVIHVAGKDPVVLDIHPDALIERQQASFSIAPWQPAVIGAVKADTPADSSRLAPGDTIVSIDGTPTPQWQDLTDIVSRSGGREVILVVTRSGAADTMAVTPAAIDTIIDGEAQTLGVLGVWAQVTEERRSLSLVGALAAGARQTSYTGTLVFRSVRGLLTARVSSRELGGPILIGQLAGRTARAGLDTFLSFMALISINLAVLNMLPIPVLDGGQFLFLLAEGILRRPLSLKLRERLTAVGLVLILMLMGLAFWNDLSRLFRGFFG